MDFGDLTLYTPLHKLLKLFRPSLVEGFFYGQTPLSNMQAPIRWDKPDQHPSYIRLLIYMNKRILRICP